jgi:transcriptional regulator GlxA family with amidase domain
MIDVLLLALPQNFASGVVGAGDLLAVDRHFLRDLSGNPADRTSTFSTRLTGPDAQVPTPFGPTLQLDCTLEDSGVADIVYIPPLAIFPGQELECDPRIIDWIRWQHDNGAVVCSACTGSLLLAATGLLDNRPATTHWAYMDDMRRAFPRVKVEPNRTLVATGEGQRIVTAGGYASWHDLMLYLIHRFSGVEAARMVARFFLLDWHDVDQQAYMCFRENLQHGDELVRDAQVWLRENLSHPTPVEAAITASGLPQRSFLRRFRRSTGLTPVRYLQHLRVETAKSLLEESEKPVDQVAWAVGYEDPAYFRRIFRRITGLTPSVYRKTFRTPAHVADLMS